MVEDSHTSAPSGDSEGSAVGDAESAKGEESADQSAEVAASEPAELSPEERDQLAAAYTDSFGVVEEKSVVRGKIIRMTDTYVVLSVGYKSDGLIVRSEFRDDPDVKIGDEVDVFIEQREDAQGHLVLSRKKARILQAWKRIQAALDGDEAVEGTIKRRTKGGLVVNLYGIEAFLPGSQIDVKPIRDFEAYVGRTMEVKVVKINYASDNVVVSHKMLIEKDMEAQKAAILGKLEKGQVLEGVIKNITTFGAFVDLGGIDGLLHVTDISWGRTPHPEKTLDLQQQVKVVVLDFDEEKRRISLGMKQLKPHPWDEIAHLNVGDKIKGRVVNVTDYGAFIEVRPGVEGLIHVSEMSWSQHLRSPSEFVQAGDQVEAMILSIEREAHKMGLGLKQLKENPWERSNFKETYCVDSRHTGTVRNITHYGVFVELEEGVDGLVHISDMSWVRKLKHPSEIAKVAEPLDVVVRDLDTENRRLSLSHKHCQENPWDSFAEVLYKGSTHDGTVLKLTDKVAILSLPQGVEGIAFLKNIVKADGATAVVGESLPFVVLDFQRDEQRVILSHTHTFKTPAERAPDEVRKTSRSTKRAIADVNKGVEKSTLGDMDALASLKKGLESKPAKKEPKEDKKKADPSSQKSDSSASSDEKAR